MKVVILLLNLDGSMHDGYLLVTNFVDDDVSHLNGCVVEGEEEYIATVVGWFHAATQDNHDWTLTQAQQH